MRLVKRFSRPGTAPGTLHPHEARRVPQVRLRATDYGSEHLEEREAASVEELMIERSLGGVLWIDCAGLHELEVLQRLGERFGLHPLALEDVLNVGQRPKIERYGDHAFLVLKLVRSGSGGEGVGWHGDGDAHAELEVEQVSLFLGTDFVLTFQEVPEDVFEPVRERLRQGKGRIRGAGADYLCYALVDALVDQFFPVLERYGEIIEELEDELIGNPGHEILRQIHRVKKDLLLLRRAAWPQREVVNALSREAPPLVRPETRIFLRDCYDHAIQIMDLLETYRDLATGMLEVYLSSVGNRTNQVMKVLTIMASIFVPLTFIAGVYGMNFDPAAGRWSMPELGWAWGYPAVLAVMAAIAGIQLWLFRRQGWW
jgi:magnesium transporter